MKVKILFFLLIITQIGLGQNLMPDKIGFLKFTPFIDGKLDERVTNLQEKKFNHFFFI